MQVFHQLFKYNYFHGFVTQELRHTEHLKDDLLAFYQICAMKIDEIVKKGFVGGTFTNMPKSEDILTLILGSTLFVIRNKNFYELYVKENAENYFEAAEKKVQTNLLVSIFSLLGYSSQ